MVLGENWYFASTLFSFQNYYGELHLFIFDSIDQIVESLLDVFHQLIKRGRDVNVSCQILTTLTTILVLYDQLV